MAIKVTKNEIDIESEIMQKLSEYGLSIEFDPTDDGEIEDKTKKEEKKDEEEE